MPKCYLDSNFLIYLLNAGSPSNKIATEKINNAVSEYTFSVSHLTLDEFLRSFPHELKQKRTQKEIFSQLQFFFNKILLIPNLEILTAPIGVSRQIEIISIMEIYKLHPRDAYHFWIMQSNNVKTFATFDNDFTKVFSDKILTKL